MSNASEALTGLATVRARASDPPAFRVLGVRVHAVQIPEVVQQLRSWIAARGSTRYVAVTGMHGVSEAQRDAAFRWVLESADLVVPDGMPLVWLGRRHGFPLARRVYGPELFATFLRQTGPLYRHYFYGGALGVADKLAESCQRQYGIQVAGTYCPPFRRLSPEEDEAAIRAINQAHADVVWVGLSTPKQENWMFAHRNRLNAPVLLGVGAAFDLNAGTLRQAPLWMRENGLEWLFRMMMEPRRLWRRYLINGSGFAWRVLLEMLGLKTVQPLSAPPPALATGTTAAGEASAAKAAD
jgi:N-acetylglucosaminyldiphosphoundecaprenol N-acetyl-beta-D-mannosaminyltransferase